MAKAEFNAAQSVFFNNGEEDLLALVVSDRGDGLLDLIVFDSKGVSSLHREVPRRDKKDYDAGGGGGRTWHS